MSTVADTAPAPEVPLTPGRRLVILMTLTLVTMLYAMTVTIANVSLPQMQGALSATTDQIALVVTFNIIATAVATPMTGWLVARFGRRGVILWGVIGFTVASLACGMATSLEALVLFRVLQGAFGAPLVPLSQAIVVDTYPKEKIGSATAIFGMGVILGPIVAPTLGGYLSEAYSWRWVFFMIVPFGLASLAGVMVFITDRRRTAVPGFDWTGFLALSVAIATFQFMLDRGQRLDWFDSAQIIACAVLAGTAFWVFVAHSLTAETPFLNPKLLLKRNYSLGLVFTLLFGMLNFTPITMLPSLLQGLRGYPDSVIGLILAVRGAGTLVGFLFMFLRGSKIDPRWTMLAGFLIQGIAGTWMSTFDINLTMSEVLWSSTLQGLGVGLIWVPLSIVTFSQLTPQETAEGSAIFHLVRNFGSSIFISVSIAIMLTYGQVNYADMSQFVSPLNEAFGFQEEMGAQWSYDSTAGLAALGGEIQRQSIMIGYINAFWAFAVVSFIACPLIFLVQLKK